MASEDEPRQTKFSSSESNFAVAFRTRIQKSVPFSEKDHSHMHNMGAISRVREPRSKHDQCKWSASQIDSRNRIVTISSDCFNVSCVCQLHRAGLLTIWDRMCSSTAQGKTMKNFGQKAQRLDYDRSTGILVSRSLPALGSWQPPTLSKFIVLTVHT